MDDMLVSAIIGWAQKLPVLSGALMILGALVVLGQIIVPLTPSDKDDLAMAKLLAIPFLGKLLLAVRAFAPFQKK